MIFPTHNHVYRNLENRKLYLIVFLRLDIKHLNCNGFAGIYAHPYCWHGETITHTQAQCEEDGVRYDPFWFVENKFEKVSELRHVPAYLI